MPGLSRFSYEEIKRMKRLNFNEGKSYSRIAQIIKRERSSDRLCTPRGVRECLKRSGTSVRKSRPKRVYINVNSDPMHSHSLTPRLVLIVRLAEESCKRVCWKNCTSTFLSAWLIESDDEWARTARSRPVHGTVKWYAPRIKRNDSSFALTY